MLPARADTPQLLLRSLVLNFYLHSRRKADFIMRKICTVLSLILVLAILVVGCGTVVDNPQDTENESTASTEESTEALETTEVVQTTEAITTPIDDSPKNVMIFGDSYSTFEGYIPKTYRTWYSTTPKPETDVTKVEETWWYRLCEEMGYNLVMNDSFSGSTLCNTGYDGADCSKTTSFIRRLEIYESKKFFEKNDIDIIFVFGCTNDSWANSPLGEYKTDTISKSDLYNVLPAIPYFIGELKRLVPDAEIVFILNTDLKSEIGDAVKKASAHYGTKYVELTSFQKRSGHPTVMGMASIAAQVKKVLS